MREETTISNSINDQKAISTITGYVLNIGIAVAVIGIMSMQAGNIYSDITTNTNENQLRIIGQKIATKITTADLALKRNPNSKGSTDLNLPSLHNSYTITIQNDTGNGDSRKIILDSSTVPDDIIVKYNTMNEMKHAELGSGSEVKLKFKNGVIKAK